MPLPVISSGIHALSRSNCQVLSEHESELLPFDLRSNACFDCKPAKVLMSAVIAHAAYTAACILLGNA